MMDDRSQSEREPSDMPSQAPPASSVSSAISVPVVQAAKEDDHLNMPQPTGLLANLKPLALLTQPKRTLLNRKPDALMTSDKAFGIASLNLSKWEPSTSPCHPSPFSPIVSIPAPSQSTPTTPRESSPEPARNSSSGKNRNLETSLNRINTLRQIKGLSIPYKARKPRVLRKGPGRPEQGNSYPPPPPPPAELPDNPTQCHHPFEILMANALLGLQEPFIHNKDAESSSQEFPSVTPKASSSPCMTLELNRDEPPDQSAQAKIPLEEPRDRSHPAKSWASFSEKHLVPLLVDLFGGHHGIEIPGICVSGIPGVDTHGTSDLVAAKSECGSSVDDNVDKDENEKEADNTLAEVMTHRKEPGAAAEQNPTKHNTSSHMNLKDIKSIPRVAAESGVKKRVIDMQELMIPLQLGWRRETKITSGPGRPHGLVTYYAPCGKKLRRFFEVEKYLSRIGISGMKREHFSFSAKVNIGEFCERKEGNKGSQWRRLQVDEIPPRLSAMECQRGRPRNSARQAPVDADMVLRREEYALSQSSCHPGDRLVAGAQGEKQKQRDKREPIVIAELLKLQEQELLLKNTNNCNKEPEVIPKVEPEDAIEDMCLSDPKPLPEFSRIPGLILPGRVVLDCLLVLHFMRNYQEVLGLDFCSNVPTLGVFQAGLLNVGDSMGRVQDLLVKLLSLAVNDPGLPPGQKSKTLLGEHLTDVDINRDNASEVLQIYMRFNSANTVLAPLARSLKTKAFQAHTPAQKSSILRFLADELACSKAVVGEIDKGLEQMADLRKDNNDVLEKLNSLRAIHVICKSMKSRASVADAPSKGLPSVLKRKRPLLNLNGDIGQDRWGEKRDEMKQVKRVKTGESCQGKVIDAVSQEEARKESEELVKEHYKNRRKSFEISHSLRSLMHGQDRYYRRYWVLPQCGGVFIEGLEHQEPRERLEEERLRCVKEEPQELYNGSISLETQPNGQQSSIAVMRSILEMKKEDDKERINAGNNKRRMSLTTSASLKVQMGAPGIVLQHSLPALPLNPSITNYNQLFQTDSSLPKDAPSKGHQVTLTPKSAPPAAPASPKPPKGLLNFQPSALQPQKVGSLPGVSFESWYRSLMAPRPLISQEGNAAARVPPMSGSPAPELLHSLDRGTARPVPPEMLTGWWRLTEVEELKALVKSLQTRGIRERNLLTQLHKNIEIIPQVCYKHRDVTQIDHKESQVSVESVRGWCVEEQAMEMDIAVLQRVEELERKVTAGCLLVKTPTCQDPHSERRNLVYYEHKLQNKSSPANLMEKHEVARRPDNPLDIAVTRLGVLERNIDRRYLSSPLCTTAQIRLGEDPNSSPPTADDMCEKEVTHGMKVWRKALRRVRSAAQLAMCIQQLQKSIAWERPIMKVYCQICRRDNQEDLLLLCDGCDKGCHTYCNEPQIATIPKEDWFCPACITKKTTSETSASREVEKTAEEMEERDKIGKKESEERSSSPEMADHENRTCQIRAKKGRDNNRDLEMCRILLTELEEHHDARPFLNSGSVRSIPDHQVVPKDPVNFLTIRLKLECRKYETLETFLSDVNMLFDNCDNLKEDLKGSALNMRNFFEKRFMELVRQTCQK